MCDDRDRRIGSILAERDDKIGKKIDKTFDMVTAQFQSAQGISPPSVVRADPETLTRLKDVETQLHDLQQRVNIIQDEQTKINSAVRENQIQRKPTLVAPPKVTLKKSS